MKRNIILLSVIGAMFVSCGLDDYYYEEDEAPAFGWFGNAEGDSILLKGNVKLGQELVYNYRLKDNEAKEPIVFLTEQEGDYDYRFEGKQFIINIKSEGVCRGTLVASDMYDKRSKIMFDLTVFKNQLPVAKCTVTKAGNLNEREVIIDMSGSYDTDSEYGGYIEKYEYVITNSNGNVFTACNGLKKIGYIFESDGLQKIDCRVCDNNGEWSEVVTSYVEFKN